jgi:hypothetical protein
MTKFIKLTSAAVGTEEKTIYINIDHIIEIHVNNDGETMLYSAYDKIAWAVKEDIDTVRALINE